MGETRLLEVNRFSLIVGFKMSKSGFKVAACRSRIVLLIFISVVSCVFSKLDLLTGAHLGLWHLIHKNTCIFIF